MGKRKRSDASAGEANQDQKHLYLVLDDWEKGYSIHRLDDNDEDGHWDWEVKKKGQRFIVRRKRRCRRRLVKPPLVRLEASKGSHDPKFGAMVGSKKIVALWQPRNRPTRATVFDAATGAVLPDGPLLPPGDLQHVRFVAASGDRLYAMHAGGLHCLEEASEDDVLGRRFSRGPPDMVDLQWRWSWARACPPLSQLPNVPWGPVDILAHAMHPDGRTLFVSACRFQYNATFSLDVQCQCSGEWTRHGDWLLPFRGQGIYDTSLDAWVGLHSPGHLCTCRVVSLSGDQQQQPEWELIEAKHLFLTRPEDDWLRQSLMTLVRLGDAHFCLLEPLTTLGFDVTPKLRIGANYLLRITKFRLKRGRNGRLRLTPGRVSSRDYKLRKYDVLFSPQAFWI